MPAGLRRIIALLYLRWERRKGTRRLYELPLDATQSRTMAVHSLLGYDLTIQTQQRVYERRYACWPWSVKQVVIYHVTGLPSVETPINLKLALHPSVFLPRLLPGFVSESVQHEFIIQAYLDIVMERLRKQSGS